MQKLIAKAREWLSNITILDVSERIVISNTSSVFIAYVFMTLYQMVIFMDSYYIVPVIMALIGCFSALVLKTTFMKMADMCRENEYNILNTKISAVIHGIKSGINHF